MTETPSRSVEERLAALEAAIETITGKLAAITEARPRDLKQHSDRERGVPPKPLRLGGLGPAGTAPLPARSRPTGHPGVFTTLFAQTPQFWISRVGIALLLAGVAYLFKYAVDQGWLTPAIRVAIGLVLGGALATVGFRVQPEKRWFSQLMLGGAAATWYITGFAAFQLLHLVSFATAFAIMVLVTVFTFAVSVRQDEAVLAVLAAIGGLGTPFFLYTESGSVPGLMTYTGIVLLGTSTIYLFKGWRSLLWTTAAGAWLVVTLGFQRDALANRIALQCAVVAIWLLFWLVPLRRALLEARDPARWNPAGSRPQAKGAEDGANQGGTSHDLAFLELAIAVAALLVSRAIWTAADGLWGAVALMGVALYAVAARSLRTVAALTVIEAAYAFTAVVLAAVAARLLLHDHLVIVAWAIEGVVVHYLAQRRAPSDSTHPILSLDVAGHGLWGVIAWWLGQRLLQGGTAPTPALNPRAVADAAVITGALCAARWVKPGAQLWYRIGAHVAILGWLARELHTLPTGDGLVTAAWGVYALALLIAVRGARQLGLATLFLAAAKLVFWDLSQVEPIWRVLLFLGFGGVFLAISYYFTDLWSGSDAERGSSDRREPPA